MLNDQMINSSSLIQQSFGLRTTIAKFIQQLECCGKVKNLLYLDLTRSLITISPFLDDSFLYKLGLFINDREVLDLVLAFVNTPLEWNNF